MYWSFTSFVSFVLNIFYSVINGIFLFTFNSLYSSCVKTLFGVHSWNLGPVHGGSGVSLYEMVSEFLIGRLGEQSLCRGQGKISCRS